MVGWLAFKSECQTCVQMLQLDMSHVYLCLRRKPHLLSVSQHTTNRLPPLANSELRSLLSLVTSDREWPVYVGGISWSWEDTRCLAFDMANVKSQKPQMRQWSATLGTDTNLKNAQKWNQTSANIIIWHQKLNSLLPALCIVCVTCCAHTTTEQVGECLACILILHILPVTWTKLCFFLFAFRDRLQVVAAVNWSPRGPPSYFIVKWPSCSNYMTMCGEFLNLLRLQIFGIVVGFWM